MIYKKQRGEKFIQYNIITVTTSNFDDIINNDDLSDVLEYFESKHYNLNDYVYKKGDSNDNN